MSMGVTYVQDEVTTFLTSQGANENLMVTGSQIRAGCLGSCIIRHVEVRADRNLRVLTESFVYGSRDLQLSSSGVLCTRSDVMPARV